MRFLIQCVSEAEVKVDSERIGHIRNGLLVLVGINKDDTYEIADKMIHKLLNLRIFQDDAGKTNLNLEAVNGGLLIVSLFIPLLFPLFILPSHPVPPPGYFLL